MRHYRIYRFDGASHIVSADWIEASNDAEAVLTAKNEESWLSREVWDRERFVGGIGPEPSSTSLQS